LLRRIAWWRVALKKVKLDPASEIVYVSPTEPSLANSNRRGEFVMAKRNRSTFERLRQGEKLSRRERRQIERQLQAAEPGWEIVHRNVAGIDVGNESHFVAIDAKQTDQPVREFGSWTAGLHQMVDWLKTCQVQRVVLQTTGVYWIPVQKITANYIQ
jgi:hypothetical protein